MKKNGTNKMRTTCNDAAYVADSDGDPEEEEAEPEDEEYEEVEDPLEAAELEAIAFLATGASLDEAMSDPDAAAPYIQEASAAFVAFGKGKGKARGKGKYPVRPSNLTIEDRRAKLQQLKQRTNCKKCGRKGHWQGDKSFPMASSGSPARLKKKVASLAMASNYTQGYSSGGCSNPKACTSFGCLSSSGSEGEAEATGYMAIKNGEKKERILKAEAVPPPIPEEIPVEAGSTSSGSHDFELLSAILQEGDVPTFTTGAFKDMVLLHYILK
jgi:hypothetical protein